MAAEVGSGADLGADPLMPSGVDYSALPGGEILADGLADLATGKRTPARLLLAIGEPRLRRLGVPLPAKTAVEDPERALYRLLAAADVDGAHSTYNAWIRRLVRFERALDRILGAEIRRAEAG